MPVTWQQLKDAIDSMTPEQLAQPVLFYIDSEEWANGQLRFLTQEDVWDHERKDGDHESVYECLERFATTVVEVLDTAGYNTQYLDVIVRDLYKAINAYTCR
jgi:hypothetical protein